VLTTSKSEGRLTIRAFGWQNHIAAQGSAALDRALRPLFLLFCVQRWLQVVSNLLIAIITIGAILLVTQTDLIKSGAQVGILLNVLIMANGTFFRLVETWTSLEVSRSGVKSLSLNMC
jgi:ATP-binding cassette subfamily C (CFTR/MRP) protein 1